MKLYNPVTSGHHEVYTAEEANAIVRTFAVCDCTDCNALRRNAEELKSLMAQAPLKPQTYVKKPSTPVVNPLDDLE